MPSCLADGVVPDPAGILLVGFFNDRRRLLHDMLVGTVVINNPVRAAGAARRPRSGRREANPFDAAVFRGAIVALPGFGWKPAGEWQPQS